MLSKFITLLLFITLSGYALTAQEPERKNRALFYKITATWCGPCGDWGWELANEVQQNRGDDQLYMAIFNSGQTTMNNRAFYNSTAVTLGFNFRNSSWPSFGVNGMNLTDKNQVDGLDINGIKQECYDSIDVFAQREVVVNAASQVALVAETLLVKTTVRFFEKAVGAYYLASYIIEDGALNYQNQQSGKVAHKGVLRGTLDSLDWGRLIVADSAEQDALFRYDYAFPLEGKDWEARKLVIYNIIWKKEGSRYRYINGSKTRLEPATGMGSVDAVADWVLYPNPCHDQLYVLDAPFIADPSVSFSIMNISGKVIRRGNWSQGQSGLDVAGLTEGVYLLSFKREDGNATFRKFIKL